MINNLKKGFTLIELIVVIAVVGVLVLLAAPKFLGYSEKANVAHIQSDIKMLETAVNSHLVKDPELFSKETAVTSDTMKGYQAKETLYTLQKGNSLVTNGDSLGGEFYEVNSELLKKVDFKTNLKGKFFYSKDSEKVYFNSDKKFSGGNGGAVTPGPVDPESKPEQPVDPDLNLPYAKDSDFEWVEELHRHEYNYAYNVPSQAKRGYYRYTGTNEIVKIPEKINGDPITSYYQMFYQSPLTSLKVISNNPNVTTMTYMFSNSQATTLDLSSFNTSKVEDMRNMFSSSNATTLDLSNFDTSKVTDMRQMFYHSKATTLNLSSFNTSKVKNMYGMFYNSSATTLDLSSFKTSKVTDMSWMFELSKATTLDLSSFKTSKVTDMSRMFKSSHATTLDLSNFDTSNFNISNVTDMYSMFQSAKATTGYAKTQADVNRFNKSNKPSALTFKLKIPVDPKPVDPDPSVPYAKDSDFTWVNDSQEVNAYTVRSQASKGYYRYTGTNEIVKIPEKINGDTITSYYKMFSENPLTSLKVISNNLNVKDMRAMFFKSQATTLNLSNFDTSNVTNMIGMFQLTKATTLDLSSFNTSNVTDMIGMFLNAQATTLNLSSFDTSDVENMRSMFSGSQATTLDLSSFNTSNVTAMNGMFYESKATTGYAGTQADADEFNKSPGKPSALTFKLK